MKKINDLQTANTKLPIFTRDFCTKENTQKKFYTRWNLKSPWTSQQWKLGKSFINCINKLFHQKRTKKWINNEVFIFPYSKDTRVLKKGKIKAHFLQLWMPKFCALLRSVLSKSVSAKLMKCEGQKWNYFWTSKPTFFQIVKCYQNHEPLEKIIQKQENK